MLIDDVKKWVEFEDEWFFDFLSDMTHDGRYGDSIYYPDDVVIDEDYISLSKWSYNRCGDSDYSNATIPVTDVLRKLRKEKIQKLNKN